LIYVRRWFVLRAFTFSVFRSGYVVPLVCRFATLLRVPLVPLFTCVVLLVRSFGSWLVWFGLFLFVLRFWFGSFAFMVPSGFCVRSCVRVWFVHGSYSLWVRSVLAFVGLFVRSIEPAGLLICCVVWFRSVYVAFVQRGLVLLLPFYVRGLRLPFPLFRR